MGTRTRDLADPTTTWRSLAALAALLAAAVLAALAAALMLPAGPIVQAAHADDEAYLLIRGDDAFFLSTANGAKNWEGSIEYKTRANGTWTEWDGDDIGAQYGVLFLRGSGNKTVAGGAGKRWEINGAATTVSCSGNVESLLEHEAVAKGEHPAMGDGCLAYLFYEWDRLSKAPVLGSTELSTLCYSHLFYGCTSLVSAPELPATTVAEGCYYEMFEGCTSLASAPTLPAKTMADRCYDEMFYGCKSLASAPELPATKLAPYCYSSMFMYCTSLTSAPKLPVTTLAEGCYYSMFRGCASLTTAPKLPAEKMVDSCYSSMFMECSALVSAPALNSTSLAPSCYDQMLMYCTSLKSAPALPATRLAEGCYKYMLAYCKSLASAPALPATTMARLCYCGMFMNCTSLTTPPAIPARNYEEYCYYRMFMGCGSLRIGKEKNGSYPYAWRIVDSAAVGSAPEDWNVEMLRETGGDFTSDPEANVTYYVSKQPVVVPAIGKVTLRTGAYTYDGRDKRPAVTVADGSGNKVPASCYTVGYSNNKSVGTAAVTVRARPGYATGSGKAAFKINPKATKVKKLSKGKRALTAKWGKVSGATGYQVAYSTSKKFAKKSTKTVTVKGAKKTSKKVSKLKGRKTYYVKVRAYQKVGGKTYWSAWSNAGKVKVK